MITGTNESSDRDLQSRPQDFLHHSSQITKRAGTVPDISRTMHRRERLRLQSCQPVERWRRERRVRHIVGQRPLLIVHEHLPASVQYVLVRRCLDIAILMKQI